MNVTEVRTCPRCGCTFDGTTIGATAEARILCPECSLRMLDERREREQAGRYWWAPKGGTDGR